MRERINKGCRGGERRLDIRGFAAYRPARVCHFVGALETPRARSALPVPCSMTELRPWWALALHARLDGSIPSPLDSSSVEQQTCNLCVAGSNPAPKHAPEQGISFEEGRRGVQVEGRCAKAPTDALIRKTTRCPALCRRGYRQAARRGGISSRFGPRPGCCGNAQSPTACLNRWTAVTLGNIPRPTFPRPLFGRAKLIKIYTFPYMLQCSI